MDTVQEAKLKALILAQRNGEDLTDRVPAEEMESTLKAIAAYKARKTSTDTLAPRRHVPSERSKQISADIEARKREESQKTQPKQLIGQGLKKFAKARGKSSSDESSGGYSTSDDDKNSVLSEETPLIAAEDEGNAKQETGEKKLSPAFLSQLGSLLDDDDMDNLDNPVQEAKTNEQDDLDYLSDLSV